MERNTIRGGPMILSSGTAVKESRINEEIGHVNGMRERSLERRQSNFNKLELVIV